MISAHSLLLSGVSAAALMASGAVAPPEAERVNTAMLIPTGPQTLTTTWATVGMGSVASDHLDITGGVVSGFKVPASLNGRRARFHASLQASGDTSIRITKGDSTFRATGGSAGSTAGATGHWASTGSVLLTTGEEYFMQARSRTGTVTTDPNLSNFSIELMPESFPGSLVAGGPLVVGNTTNRKVPFEHELYDNGGWCDLAVNPTDFVVPPGVFLIRMSGGLQWPSAASSQMLLGIWKNGVDLLGGGIRDVESATIPNALTVSSGPVFVIPGDVLSLYLYNASTYNVVDSDFRWMQIEALDPSTRFCTVRRSSNFAVPSATNTTVNWNAKLVDQGGWYDPAQPTRLTVPEGVKQVKVGAGACRTSSTGQWIVMLYKNGQDAWPGAVRYENDTLGQDFSQITTGVIDVVPGDYFEIVVFGQGSSFVQATNSSWFTIEEVYGKPQTDGGVLEDFFLTVKASKIDADLDNFPVMVDLATMPASFWDGVQSNGGNIRARDRDALLNVPHDLTFIDKDRKIGKLFVRQDLSSTENTTFAISLLEDTSLALPPSDPAGSHRVWEDYLYSVVLPTTTNRSPNPASVDAAGWQPPTEWIRHGFRTLTGSPHQGIASDGTNFIWVDTNTIRRGDMTYVVQASNLNVSAALATAGLSGIDHLSDPVIHDGAIWLTATKPRSGTPSYERWLVRFNLTTLAPEEWFQIDPAYYQHGATLLHDGTHFVLFSFYVFTHFIRVTETGDFVSQTTLSQSLNAVQGSTLLPNGNFLLCQNSGAVNEVTPIGTVLGQVYSDPHAGVGEGIQYLDIGGVPHLFVLKGDGNLVTLRKDNEHYDYRKIHRSNVFATVPAHEEWSMGGAVWWTTTDLQQSFISVYNPDTLGHLGNVIYDEGPDRVGSWHENEGWLYTTPLDNPAAYTDRLYGFVYTPTLRKLWNEGRKDEAVIASPVPTPENQMRFILNASRPGVEQGEAYYQHLWLRPDAVSDAWMKADYDNKKQPSMFYSVEAWTIASQGGYLSDSGNWSNYTARMAASRGTLPPGAKRFRFTLAANVGAGGTVIENMVAGLGRGLNFRTDKVLVPVSVRGASTFLIPAGQSIVTDPIDLDYEGEGTVVLSAYMPSGSAPNSRMSVYSHAWFWSAYKSGDHSESVLQDWSTGSTSNPYLIEKVEVFGSGDWSTVYQPSFYQANGGWGNYTLRLKLDPGKFDLAAGDKRMILGGSMTKAFIGYGNEIAGDFNFDETPVPLLSNQGQVDHAAMDPTERITLPDADSRSVIVSAHTAGNTVYRRDPEPGAGTRYRSGDHADAMSFTGSSDGTWLIMPWAVDVFE